MINLPKGTFFNKRIAKQKFYDKLSLSTNLEKQFVKEIDTIVWKNKISHETINLSIGTNVTEIEVFEITLKEQNISQNVIEFIDREIPYHLVFVLRYNDMAQICISFKEGSKNREGKFKVNSYYKTDWQKYEDLFLEIEGLDLDKVYENFMIQVSNGMLNIDDGLDIKDAVEKAKKKDKIEKYIQKLEEKIKNEKQFNRQVHLMGELRKVKKQLEVG